MLQLKKCANRWVRAISQCSASLHSALPSLTRLSGWKWTRGIWQVRERGYGVLRGVANEKCVEDFVKQIEEYMRAATTPDTVSQNISGIRGMHACMPSHRPSSCQIPSQK